MEGIIVVIVLFVAVAIILISRSPSVAKRQRYNAWIASLSDDEKEFVQKVSVFAGKKQIDQEDIRKYNIHQMSKLFSSMPGWDTWDKSIHEVDGQYARMEKAALKDMTVISYRPQQTAAVVQGESGSYNVSCDGCSCQDFQYRHLPCKHMYLLAMELDGNADQTIPAESI